MGIKSEALVSLIIALGEWEVWAWGPGNTVELGEGASLSGLLRLLGEGVK